MIWYVFVNDIQGERKRSIASHLPRACAIRSLSNIGITESSHSVYPLSLLRHHAWLRSQTFLSAYKMVSQGLSGSFDMTQNLGKILDSAGLASNCRSRDRGSAKRPVTHRSN